MVETDFDPHVKIGPVKIAIKKIFALSALLFLGVFIQDMCISPENIAKAGQITKNTTQSATQESWITLPESLESATQGEIGAEIYQLVCSTCHGDKGQGLTEEWIARIGHGAQGCWQSKCHISNHPPDGFVLPRDVPALAGPNARPRFETALELYTFIRNFMPYQAPGTMLTDEYWAVTAFLVELKGIPLNGTLLDPAVAGTIYFAH